MARDLGRVRPLVTGGITAGCDIPSVTAIRFGAAAMRVVDAAFTRARLAGDAYVCPDDLLLSLTMFPSETARLLARLGGDMTELANSDWRKRSAVHLPHGERAVLDVDAQKMIDAAFGAAIRRDRTEVTPAHLLYSIVQQAGPWLEWRLWSAGLTPSHLQTIRASLRL